MGLVPTYSVIYGAFATLPIFLLWIYLSWVVVLLGAVIAAYAPSLAMRVARVPDTPGYRFALAVSLLRELTRVRGAGQKGLSLAALAAAVRVDPLQVEPVLESLIALDWVARLDEDGERRHVLLADPQATLAAPLVDSLLLEPTLPTQAFRARAAFASMKAGRTVLSARLGACRLRGTIACRPIWQARLQMTTDFIADAATAAARARPVGPVQARARDHQRAGRAGAHRRRPRGDQPVRQQLPRAVVASAGDRRRRTRRSTITATA